jgi:hypothetical protein
VGEPRAPSDGGLLWHVTLTLAGQAVPLPDIRDGLERLSQERPFLLTGRYAEDRVELRYWEEARDVDDAAALALRVWGEHRVSAGLPPWQVVGLEVVERDMWQRRTDRSGAGMLMPAGLRPF